jgi:hypothetical protein
MRAFLVADKQQQWLPDLSVALLMSLFFRYSYRCERPRATAPRLFSVEFARQNFLDIPSRANEILDGDHEFSQTGIQSSIYLTFSLFSTPLLLNMLAFYLSLLSLSLSLFK